MLHVSAPSPLLALPLPWDKHGSCFMITELLPITPRPFWNHVRFWPTHALRHALDPRLARPAPTPHRPQPTP